MDKLAILGGKKAIQLEYENVGKVDEVSSEGIANAVKLMKKGEISISSITEKFEEKFAKYIETKYALTLNNGTSSLISALYAIGVGPGDEVIVPSFSFWATATCVHIMNAIPVFCDIDKDTYNMDACNIEKKITSKTKAIIIVHIFGNPVNMDDVMDIAKKYNLKVIEDCSHAHGALWKDKKVGSIGDIGCFSMQGEKLLSAGEGGIMVTNNQEYYERAIALGHYERIGSLPYNKYSKYCFTGMGYKFRIHPIAVAIADCNLNRLDELNDIRNKNAQYLENNIKNTDGIIMQKIYSNATRQYSYHYATYHKEKFCNLSIITFLNALREEGVKYKLCGYGKYHKTSIFTEKYTYANGQTIEENVVETKISLPISEYLSDNIFMLAPRFEKDCKEIIDQYIYAYQKIYQNIEELKYYEEKKLGQGNENSVKIDMLKAIGQLRRYKKSN